MIQLEFLALNKRLAQFKIPLNNDNKLNYNKLNSHSKDMFSHYHVWFFVTPWTAECQSPLSFTVSWSLLKFMPIELMVLSSLLVLCYLLILCLQFFPASGSFPTSWLLTSGGQNIGALVLVSVLWMSTQDWFPLGLTGWISLQSKGLSRVFSNTTVQKHQFFGAQPSLWSNSYTYTWLFEKP